MNLTSQTLVQVGEGSVGGGDRILPLVVRQQNSNLLGKGEDLFDDIFEEGYEAQTRRVALVQAFSFRVSGFGFRVSGFGFRVSGFGFLVSGFGFRVSGFGFRVQGSGFRWPRLDRREPVKGGSG